MDKRQARTLMDQANELQFRSLYQTPRVISQRISSDLAHELNIARPLRRPLAKLVDAMIEEEIYLHDLKHKTVEQFLERPTEYRVLFEQKKAFFENDRENYQELYETLKQALTLLVGNAHGLGTNTLYTTPLYALYGQPDAFNAVVWHLTDPLSSPFRYLPNQLYKNMQYMVYGKAEPMYIHTQDVEDVAKKAYHQEIHSLLRKLDYTNLPMHEYIRQLFKNTQFTEFLTADVALNVTQKDYFEHAYIVGGSGAGKTQFLQNLFLSLIDQHDPPSVILVDSQGDMIRNISSLVEFTHHSFGVAGRLDGRLTIIDPKDTKHPPAINVFDVNRERLQEYDEAMREQVAAGVIDTFDYLFSGMMADLTAKQSVFFKMVARLMLTIPDVWERNATVLDIMKLLDNPDKYTPVMEAMPDVHRTFFFNDFNQRTFNQTKEQIRYRLNAILENPTLYRLFTQPYSKLDMLKEINGGGIVLVDTAKDFLKSGSPYFGRFFISQVMQAMYERAAQRYRPPAYLIVDEAAEYFDQNIDDLLTQARKYNVGCIFAHQYLNQATPQLRASLSANTKIKLASNVSSQDAKSLAQDMHTTPDDILAQPKLTFSCYVAGKTKRAVPISVEAGLMEAREKMDKTDRAALTLFNREKVSLTPPQKSQSTVNEMKRDIGDDPTEPTDW